MFSAFKNQTFQIIFCILLYVVTSQYLPEYVDRSLYTISLSIKEILIWLMPIVVFAFISSSIRMFKKNAIYFILAIVIFEALSNGLSVWYTYFITQFVTSNIAMEHVSQDYQNIIPFFKFSLYKPSFYTVTNGLLLGLIFGLWVDTTKLKNVVQMMFTHGFSRIIPIYILGFIANMHKSGVMDHLITSYSLLILILFAIMASYVIIIYFIAAGLNFSKMMKYIRGIIPAWVLGISSCCSLSTMPVTIACTEKMLHKKSLAKIIIPSTTNIQQIGDCIANAFLCCVIFYHFYGATIAPAQWFAFSLVFVLARFGTSGMSGGAIFVMLPIYEKYLSFNPEMIALMLALNVILDPIITSVNIVANAGLCVIFEKFLLKMKLKIYDDESQ